MITLIISIITAICGMNLGKIASRLNDGPWGVILIGITLYFCGVAAVFNLYGWKLP